MDVDQVWIHCTHARLLQPQPQPQQSNFLHAFNNFFALLQLEDLDSDWATNQFCLRYENFGEMLPRNLIPPN